MKHRVRAAGLLIKDQHILLVLHRLPETGAEWWIPPGGGLEEMDQTIFDAARREIFEETGLHVNPSRIAYIREFREISNRTYHLEFFLPIDSYSGQITMENIPVNDIDYGIIKSVQWLHQSELQDLVVWPDWIKEDWFWEDARNGFPVTRYTGVSAE